MPKSHKILTLPRLASYESLQVHTTSVPTQRDASRPDTAPSEPQRCHSWLRSHMSCKVNNRQQRSTKPGVNRQESDRDSEPEAVRSLRGEADRGGRRGGWGDAREREDKSDCPEWLQLAPGRAPLLQTSFGVRLAGLRNSIGTFRSACKTLSPNHQQYTSAYE